MLATPSRPELARIIARSEALISELIRRFLQDEEDVELPALSFCKGASLAEQLQDRDTYAALILLSVVDRWIGFVPYFPDENFDPDDQTRIHLTPLGRAVFKARLAAETARS